MLIVLKDIRQRFARASHERVKLFFIIRTRRENEIKYGVLKAHITYDICETFIDIAKKKIDELLETEDLRLERYDPVAVWDQPTVEFIEGNKVKQLNKILKDME